MASVTVNRFLEPHFLHRPPLLLHAALHTKIDELMQQCPDII